VQHVHVAPDLRAHARPQHLHDGLAAVGQGGGMHLGDRGGRQRLVVEAREQRSSGCL
jgi:hypothetical protein